METLLIYSQIIFNLVISVVVLLVGILLCVFIYRVLKITSEAKDLVRRFTGFPLLSLISKYFGDRADSSKKNSKHKSRQ